MLAVFRNVINSPIIKAFCGYCESQDKPYAYGNFCSVIYSEGGSLSNAVKKAVYEDENVYIKALAHDKSIDENIVACAKRELNLFSDLASLTSFDFAEDMKMGQSLIPAFSSQRTDVYEGFCDRVRNIHRYGYGIFSSYSMFRLADDRLEPIISADKTRMDSFIGYEEERQKVIDNTIAFIENRPAANTLLCGDAGTGKSSTVKAIANDFFDQGIRLIELRKDQLAQLPSVMGKISENPLKFIIFIDDLSFNSNDDNFSMLKAALEGSASAKAENAVIYATSNRRHIIKESFSDRDGDDLHVNDTLAETLSLSERFGLVVLFSKPDKKLYLRIVKSLAIRYGITMDEKKLEIDAEAFALRKGNRSARCAEQFIESLL